MSEEVHPVISELIERIESGRISTSFGEITDDISGVAQMPARDYRQEPLEPLEYIDLDNQCCVCYKNPEKIDFIKSECGHNYCNTCFFTWLKQSPTCAMCRHNFTDWTELDDEELEPLYTSLKKQYKRKKALLKSTLFKITRLEERVERQQKYNKTLFSRQLRLNALREYTEGYNLGYLESGDREDEFDGDFRKGYCDGALNYHKKYCKSRRACMCDEKVMAHKEKDNPISFEMPVPCNRKITIKRRDLSNNTFVFSTELNEDELSEDDDL